MSEPFWILQGTQRRKDGAQIVLRGVRDMGDRLAVTVSVGPDPTICEVGYEPDPLFTINVGEHTDVGDQGRLAVLDAVRVEGRPGGGRRSSALLRLDRREESPA
ncbi:MAG: hypothetical protein FWE61_00790 [Micrococcales bacterium]|nr:hypothetical protein [Micrococcales bacterium]